MAHQVIGGKNGAVDGESTVGKWSVSYQGNPWEYYASNTLGASGQLAGNNDWSGSYELLGYEALRMPGEEFTFKGSVNGTKGCSGNAIVDSIVVTAAIATGGSITTVINFSSNGALNVGDVVATDETVPQPPEAKNAKIFVVDSEETDPLNPIEVPDVQSVTMTITADNKEYVADGETLRIAGNFTVTLSYDMLESDWLLLPAPNDNLLVYFYVDLVTKALFWELKWMTVDTLTDLKCDIDTNEIVGATVNTKFNGFLEGATGHINAPAESPSNWWPA